MSRYKMFHEVTDERKLAAFESGIQRLPKQYVQKRPVPRRFFLLRPGSLQPRGQSCDEKQTQQGSKRRFDRFFPLSLRFPFSNIPVIVSIMFRSLRYNILIRSIFRYHHVRLESCFGFSHIINRIKYVFFSSCASRCLIFVAHDIVAAMSDQRPYLAPLYPKGQDGSQTTVRWFPSAIVVAICGFVVLLIIASLAVRWLHPIPPQNTNKFVPCRTSDNGPPLLGLPKVPLV